MIGYWVAACGLHCTLPGCDASKGSSDLCLSARWTAQRPMAPLRMARPIGNPIPITSPRVLFLSPLFLRNRITGPGGVA